MNALLKPLSIFAAVIAVAMAPPAQAQKTRNSKPTDEAASIEELRSYCKTSAAPCRENLRIVLQRKNGRKYDKSFELMPPAVQPGFLTIHPGETVKAVPEFENGKFAGWRLPKPDEPAGTQILTINLEQSDKNESMMAIVRTNTGPALKLNMGLIRLDGHRKPESTSSCGLRAGGFSSYEMWPYPIFTLIVTDAKRLADDEAVTCQ